MDNLIYVMMERGFGWNLIRSLFAWLDTAIYTVFGWVMQLIFDICEISSNPALQNFYDDIHTRIYGVLAIFMLFKITVSMLTYLVNPDTIGDKERGVSKMISRVILSLIMLLGFPTLFEFFLVEVQPHLLEALPRIVLGVNGVDNESTGSDMQLAGDKISFSIYNGVWFNQNCADENQPDDLGNINGCFKYTPEVGKTFMSLVPEHINDEGEDDSTYRYDYYPVVGLVVGIVITLIIVGICVDVAIRLFKLIILQMIAPIPILSYIDPKSSKDGAFSKWIKMVISVYLDLFIKLAVVYFMILVINSLIVNGVVQSITANLFRNNGVLRGCLVLVALVVGLLFFAKDAPKFISDALGIKSGENGKLFGGLGKIMAAGAIGAGAIGAGVAAGRASYMSDEARDKSHNPLRIAKNVGAGLFGSLSGAKSGLNAATSAKDHHAKAAMDAMAKKNAINLSRGAAGSTLGGRLLEAGVQLISGETYHDLQKRGIKNKEKFINDASSFDKDLKAEAIKGKYGPITVNGGGRYLGDQDITGNSKSLRAQAQVAISKGEEFFYYDNGTGVAKKVSTTDYESIASDMEKQEMESLFALFASGNDAGNVDLYQDYLTATKGAESLGHKVSSRKDLDDYRKNVAADVSETKRSASYQAGEANSNEVKK